MENQTNIPQQGTAYNTKTITGIALLGLGLILLLKGAGFLTIISWPVMIIGLGFYLGLKNHFRKPQPIVLMAVGFVFLLPNIIPSLGVDMLWPLPMICLGLFMVLRSKQRWNGNNWEKVN